MADLCLHKNIGKNGKTSREIYRVRQVGYNFGIKAGKEIKLLSDGFKKPRQERGQLIYQIFRSHEHRKNIKVERRLKKLYFWIARQASEHKHLHIKMSLANK